MSVDADYPQTLGSGYPSVGGGSAIPGIDTNAASDQILGGLSATGTSLPGMAGAGTPRVLRHNQAHLPEWDDYQRGDNRATGMAREQSRMEAARKQSARAYASRTSSLDEFNAEFWDRWEDPMFQQWFRSRLVASGKYKSLPTTEQSYVAWVNIGEQAAGAQGWKGTPEQLLEFWASGVMKSDEQVTADMKAGSLVMGPDGQVIDEANPIQTHTSTAYTSINPLAANAAVDQLSQALLGRMASKAEMARYRKAMNKILRSSPTVTTTTTDSTDPDNVTTTSRTKDGASASDAEAAIRMRMQRGSEGMAFNAGKMIEQAMRMMG